VSLLSVHSVHSSSFIARGDLQL